MARSDRRYLELHSGKWRVSVAVPRNLQGQLGTRLKRTLQTDSLAVANKLKWAVVSELRASIEGASEGRAHDPLRREAVEVAEYRARAVTEAERAMITDAAVDRAHELLGDPIGTEVGPATDEPHYEYDPKRQAQADAYADIALGRATPIDLHHDRYLAQSATRPRSKANDRRVVKFLLEWCERRGVRPTIQAITRKVAVRFKDEMREVAGDLRPVTLNKYLERLSHYWRWLQEREDVESDPWARLKVPPLPRSREGEEAERSFTDAEVLALLNGPAPERMLHLMKIAALTGARLDAIVSLRVDDCVGGVFAFMPQKLERKRRSVPIHSELVEIVARRAAGKAGDDSLFPEWPGPRKPGSQRERSFRTTNAFTAYRRSVGVEQMVPGKRRSLVNFHSFRRWFITKAEQAGQPEHIIAVVVGHKRKGITLGLYSGGPLLEQIRQCVEAVRLPAGL
jgi:integrase